MKKRSLVLLFLAAVLLAAVAVGLLIWQSAFATKKVPEKVLLEADFESLIIEHVPEDPIAQIMMEDTPRLRDLIAALDRAAEDERVVGLVARIGAGQLGLAQIQELRDAVGRFRAAGKKAVAWSETFGEVGPGNTGYYLATAFDEIYLQPSGDVGLTGFIFESMFLRGAFEKVGVTPKMDHRHEYKNAKNMYTETAFTEAHRDAMETIMNSMFGQVVRGIGEARGLSEDEVRGLVDGGPYYGQETVDVGLIDGLAYRDEVYDGVREQLGDGTSLLFLESYAGRASQRPSGPTVALIYGVGPIHRGHSQYSPFDGSISMGSDSVAAAFRAAIDDDKVEAIIFRLDCPGGSYVASDAVWRETVRAREAGKPVIATMGNVAGSGGYFVAMSADKIVAQPSTITGSIGVVAGKLLTSEMWPKTGISFDSVQTSDNADMWVGNHDYDDAEWARFQTWLDRVYDDFTAKVAAGRQLPIERVRDIAKGRIWSGEDALELGLVDALGGLETALELAREAAGLAADAEIRLVEFPKKRTPFEQLFGDSPSSSEDRAAVVAVERTMAELAPVVRVARQLGIVGEPRGVLTMPIELEGLR